MELTGTQSVFVLIGVIGVLIVLMIYVARGNTGRKIKALLEEQANKRNGKVTSSAAMFSGPSLLFEVQGVEVEIVMTSGSWTRYGSIPGSTCIRANFPKKSEKQFHIFREEVLGRIEKVLGFQDIQLGDDTFDREFMIKSNDEVFLRSVLTPNVTHHILSNAGHHSSIEFNGGHLLLTVFYIVVSRQQLEGLINTVLLMVERLKEVEL